MRNGIIDKLPTTLAQDKIVLVLGSTNTVAQNGIRSLISELDPHGAWINFMVGENISEKSMPRIRVGVILTISGLGHGSLTNARRIAKGQGIHCPHQALTAGETKEVLRLLAQARTGIHRNVPNGSANGNGHHDLSASKNGTSQPVSADPIQEVVAQPLMDPTPAIAMIAEEPAEVLTAITALENFRKVSDEAEIAVMVLGDRVTSSQRQLVERDATIADLQTRLATTANLASENKTLTEKNRQLEAKVNQLNNTIGQFESIIRGVRQK